MFDIVHSNVVMIPPLYPAGPFVHFHYSLLNSLPPNMAKKVRSTSIKAWWSSTFIVLLKYSVVAASSPHLFICHSVLRSTHYALLYITWAPFQLGGPTRWQCNFDKSLPTAVTVFFVFAEQWTHFAHLSSPPEAGWSQGVGGRASCKTSHNWPKQSLTKKTSLNLAPIGGDRNL